MNSTDRDVVDYRLAPAIVLRVAGAAMVVLAALVLVLGVVAAVSGWPAWPVALAASVGLVAVAVTAWWALRVAYVVRLDPVGYRVRLVRGAGASRARWIDVTEASTGQVSGVACVVIGLRDGRTTTVPVAVLSADRDEFVTRVRALLRHAH